MALKTAFTMLDQKNNIQYGFMTILSIVFTFLFIGIMVGIFNLLIAQNRLAKKMQAEEIALPIAEAGINYYRWHLTQDKDDYADGDPIPCVYPNTCGPYTHNYSDPLAPPNTRIGEFQLYITPPPPGSTLVTIKSTGIVDGFPNQSKTIEAQYGIPSLAKYAILSDADIWIEGDENISGPIHSNFGIRMDGNSNSIVSSALSTYICNDITGCNPNEVKNGIWAWDGTVSDLWQLSVNSVDLTLDLDDLTQMRTEAQTNGAYYESSQVAGYKIVFNPYSNTFDVYKINELKNAEQQYNDDWLNPLPPVGIADEPKANQIVSIELGADSNNGLIFIEDNVWVSGTINGRFTLVSAKLTGNPADYTSIRIDGNITYSNYDGSDILGLIAEKDIKVPKYAPDNLTINAILLALNGKIFRNRYVPPSIKSSISIYGSMIAKQGLRWKWCSEQICDSININDGYSITTTILDTNAEFAPPPYFPNTGKYTFVSWKEKVANQP